MTDQRESDIPEQFKEWFRKNYPGPNTIIYKPDFHSPSIYRAAIAAMGEAQVRVTPAWEAFGRDMLEHWPVRDVDGSEFFEAALRHGLIREIPGGYDPDQHIDAEGIAPERGDPWYEYAFDTPTAPITPALPQHITDALERLPDGFWEVWTSCSFRRISRRGGGDGDVLCGTIQRSDGHPDLSWNEQECQALCDLVNGLRTLAQQDEAREGV